MQSTKQLFLTVILSLFLFSVVNAQSIEGNLWDDVLTAKKGELTIAFFEEPAFAFKNGNGTYSGVQIDILHQFVNWLKHTHGVELTVNYVPFDDFSLLLETVRNSKGGVIGAGNISITEERKEFYEFSPPYLNNLAVLMTHADVPELKSLSDLNSAFTGKKAVAFSGTTHEEVLKDLQKNYYPGMEFEYVTSDQEAINAVVSDTNKFTLLDLFSYWLATQENQPVRRHAVADQATDQFGFIFPKGSGWAKPMSVFFNMGAGYRSNIAYKRILLKYLGSDVTTMLEIAAKKNGN